MIRIHTLLIGEPRIITDEKGSWESAIFRSPVEGPVELAERGLQGDQVADTAHHGSADQGVCCHPLGHYDYWNERYNLHDPATKLGPGSVGENWTLSGVSEEDVCVGDIYRVGSARVRVAGPRYPCNKQERKVGLPGFLRNTIETLRTGFYLRVLTPGTVSSGDVLTLEERPYPSMTIQRINECGHHTLDPEFARAALDIPELMPVWKFIFRTKLGDEKG